MNTTALSDFHRYISGLTESPEPLIINRGEHPEVIMISLEEYNALHTTLQGEMSSNKNKVRLDVAIAKFRNGKSFSKELF